jgi:hypothetical protein
VTVQNCVGGTPRECLPGTAKDETCNLLDDDCDGTVDEDLPVLECGTGACAVKVPSCIDGRPQPCWPLPPNVAPASINKLPSIPMSRAVS